MNLTNFRKLVNHKSPKSSKLRTGRPLINLSCNDELHVAFIDTGSSATLVKQSSLSYLETKNIKACNKNLRNVSGSKINVYGAADIKVSISPLLNITHRFIVVSGLDFPGDILLGMDFLRRFDYNMAHDRALDRGHITLQGSKFPIQYTDAQSQCVRVISTLSTKPTFPIKALFKEKPNLTSTNAHVRRSTVCLPHTARFVCASLSSNYEDGSSVIIETKIDSLQIPRMVTTVKDNKVNIFLVNDTNISVKLPNGICIAAVETVASDCIDSVASLSSTEGNVNSTESNLDLDLDSLDLAHLSSRRRKTLLQVLSKYKDLFSGDKSTIGNIPDLKHSIVTNNESPLHIRQWRLPQSSKEIIKKTVKEMHNSGVIEPSSSPWMSPVVLVRKKNGDIRFCIDYRALNNVTVADQFPLPRIEELIDDLGNTSYFSVLDARSAYWSVSMNEKDKAKTAFSDGSRLWQFKRMPYGLRNAPATFQRAMNTILNPVLGKHALAYLDDIIIFSSSFEDHLLHLDETLTLLNRAGLKLNLQKCNFLVKEIKFLGFLISSKGISPDPGKVKSINDMPIPKDVTEIRRSSGAVGFFRRHIPIFSTIAVPLT